MTDFLVVLLCMYGVIAVSWFFAFFTGWYSRRRMSYGVVADRVWHARMALLAPVWLPFLMFVGGHLLAERWHPAGVGRMIGDFALDAKGRSDDD